MSLFEVFKQLDGTVALAVMIFMWLDLKKKHSECEKDRKELWQRIAKIAPLILACIFCLGLCSCGFTVSLGASKQEGQEPVYTIDLTNAK